jgi:hypothetical protein
MGNEMYVVILQKLIREDVVVGTIVFDLGDSIYQSLEPGADCQYEG